MLARIFAIAALLALPLLTVPAYAQPKVDVFDRGVCKNADTNQSAVCKDKAVGTTDNNPISGSEGVLTKIINLLTVIVAIVAVITIIMAGLKFITSSTNPQDVANARERIIYSVVALVIAALAQFLVRFILNVV